MKCIICNEEVNKQDPGYRSGMVIGRATKTPDGVSSGTNSNPVYYHFRCERTYLEREKNKLLRMEV